MKMEAAMPMGERTTLAAPTTSANIKPTQTMMSTRNKTKNVPSTAMLIPRKIESAEALAANGRGQWHHG